MRSFSREEILADFQNWQTMIKKYQKPNFSKALRQVISSFGLFLGLWFLQFWLFDFSSIYTILVAIVNGFLLGRIFIIQHDCGHTSFTANQKFNDWLGTICSLCTFIPYRYWSRSHSFHHAHNAQLEFSDIGDIECLSVKEYAAKKWHEKLWYRIYRNPLYLFTIGGFIYVVLYNRFVLLKTDYFKTVKRDVLISNITFIMFYALMAYTLGVKKFLFVQFINLFFFGTLALWFFYIQHQYENIYKSKKEEWNYVLAAIKGSTYYDLPGIFHWLTGNIGYHHIHHLSPVIPNYNLPSCHQEVSAFQKHAQRITFVDSLKTVFANLWDEQNQRMISFRQYTRMKKAGLLSHPPATDVHP